MTPAQMSPDNPRPPRRWRIVFDLDGTLVDSAPHCAAILNDMLADHGEARDVDLAAARPHITRGGEAMVRELLQGRCGSDALALDEFRRRYGAAPTPADSLYSGVRQGLDRLRAGGASLAVWSNKPQSLCEKVLSDLSLDRTFSRIVGTGPGVPHKPHLAGFDLALDGAGRNAALLVGDSQADYDSARAAGVPAVMASYGYGESTGAWRDALIAPDFPAIVETLLSAMTTASRFQSLPPR